jgi:hypothetical protein
MSLILRNNLTRPLTHDELDGNLVYLNIAEWVKKGYLEGQYVLVKTGTIGIIYYCEMTHSDFIYNKYGAGNFIQTYVEDSKLFRVWRQIGSTEGGSGGYTTIEDGGVPLIERSILSFTGEGVKVTDDPVNGRTIVTIDGSGSGSTNITDYTINGTVLEILLTNDEKFSLDVNDVKIKEEQYSIGISNHSYELITTSWEPEIISGETYNTHQLIFGFSEQPAKQNIVVIDLNTSEDNHHLVYLPTNLTEDEAGIIYKIIAKSSNNTNLDKYLMVFSPDLKIISSNIKTKYNDSYFLPLETMESVEIIWDGYDYLVTNMVKQGYTALNAKNFIEMNTNVDPLFDTCYIQRDINSFL